MNPNKHRYFYGLYYECVTDIFLKLHFPSTLSLKSTIGRKKILIQPINNTSHVVTYINIIFLPLLHSDTIKLPLE